MEKVVGIHQPNFLPWIGYFYKIINSDIFVFLDDAQYIKRNFINRNKIKTKDGTQYIRLPLIQKGRYKQLISECELHNKKENIRIIINAVKTNYSKAKYFEKYFEEFKDILDKNINNLLDLNILFIKWILNILNIEKELIKSSELKNILGTSTERLISICKNVNGNKYFSGIGGNKYQDKEMFKKLDIELIITDFEHPVYNQLWGDFIPNLSIIDLIFNYGKDSKKIILDSKRSK